MATPGLNLTVGGCECCCIPGTIVADYYISQFASWNLTTYQAAGYANASFPGVTVWRIISLDPCDCRTVLSGTVTNGTLDSLPASYTNNDCNAYFDLQVGCPDYPEDCTPQYCSVSGVIASATTNSGNPTWDLSSYQNVDQGNRCPFNWRVIETGACVTHHSGSGSTTTGYLTGLPASFTSIYGYDGYMELQIACWDCHTGTYIWPGSCP